MRLLEIDVWLEVGREGRTFSYGDSKQLGIDLGDIVLVGLRGRRMHGLVVGKRVRQLNSEAEQLSLKKKELFSD